MIPNMEHSSIIKDVQSHGIPVLDDGHTYCIRVIPTWKSNGSIHYLAAKLRSEFVGTFSTVLRIVYEPKSLHVKIIKTGSLMNSIRLLKNVEHMTDDDAALALDSHFFNEEEDADKVMTFCF